MSQEEVYQIMKDGKWHTVKEIADKLDININTVRTNIMRLDASSRIIFERREIIRPSSIQKYTKYIYKMVMK